MSRMEPVDGPRKLSVVCNVCGKPWNDGHGHGRVFCEAEIREMVEEVRATADGCGNDQWEDGYVAALDAILARLGLEESR